MNSIQFEPDNKNIFCFREEGFSIQECTDKKIRELTVLYLQAFCDSTSERSKAAWGIIENLETENLSREDKQEQRKQIASLITKGAWYASEYRDILYRYKELDTSQSVQDLFNSYYNRGWFYHGIPPEGFLHGIQKRENYDYRIHALREPNKPLLAKRDEMYHYSLEDGEKASDALDSLLPLKNSRVFFIDSRIAVQIAQYCVLRRIFGENLFNRYCQRHSFELNSSKNIAELTQITFPNRVSYGDICYIQNACYYPEKHPNGKAMGYHAICTQLTKDGHPQFSGFGLKDKEMSLESIYEQLAEEFNENPMPLTNLLPENLANQIDKADQHPKICTPIDTPIEKNPTQFSGSFASLETIEEDSVVAARDFRKISAATILVRGGLQDATLSLSHEKIQDVLKNPLVETKRFD